MPCHEKMAEVMAVTLRPFCRGQVLPPEIEHLQGVVSLRSNSYENTNKNIIQKRKRQKR
jgi:hypothetical protein